MKRAIMIGCLLLFSGVGLNGATKDLQGKLEAGTTEVKGQKVPIFILKTASSSHKINPKFFSILKPYNGKNVTLKANVNDQNQNIISFTNLKEVKEKKTKESKKAEKEAKKEAKKKQSQEKKSKK
ncbi:MAG: hypothetical protein NE327_15560 [Lentisphaeraceae bacterium]|nr:hypothetical protein [Lentisphaeraceae bacterium]